MAGEQDERSETAEASALNSAGDPPDPAEYPGEAAEAAEAAETAETAEAAEAADDDADPDAADELVAQIDELRAELDSRDERYLRLAAEFDNYRKRVAREREDARSRARAESVTPLLEVLDDLQRVSDQDPATTSAEGVIEGARLVEKKFRHALASLGLEPIQAENEFFNPAIMDALMTVPTTEEADDDSVAQVFEKGYRLGDVLIRPARVSVKKYEAAADESDSE